MIRIEGVAEATKFCFQLNHHFSATTHSSRGFSKHDLEEIIERMQATFTGSKVSHLTSFFLNTVCRHEHYLYKQGR